MLRKKYYIESLHICVLEWQEYGLAKSTKFTKFENTCEEFLVDTYINSSSFEWFIWL